MLTKEQFNGLRSKGLSTEQIIKFDQGWKPTPTERDVTTSFPERLRQSLSALFPQIAGAQKVYSAVHEPLTDIATKTALVPKALSMLPGKLDAAQPNPAAPFLPTPLREALPPIKRTTTGPEMAKQVAGAGVDTLLGIGAEGLASKAGNVAGKVGETLGNMKNPVQFAKNVRNSMFGMRSKIGQELDSQITALSAANPEKTIDLSEHFESMKSAMNDPDNPGLKGDIVGTLRKIKNPETAKLLQSLIRNPESASNLTLRQAEDIKRAISQSPTISSKMAQGRFANWTPGDIEMKDLLDNIKSTQSEVFDELSEIRKPYAKFMNAYNKVKGKFREGRLLGGMRKGFGDEETQNLIKEVLPPEVLSQINNFRRTGKVIKGGLATTGVAGGLGGAEYLLKKIFRG